ncbi:hypothetical protein D3C81_1452090 [compost metagenome]
MCQQHKADDRAKDEHCHDADHHGEQGRHDQSADYLGQHGLYVGDRHRFPEQHTAIAAVVIQRAEAIEEGHEAQYQERPRRADHQREVHAVGPLHHVMRRHLRGQHLHVQAVDVDAIDMEIAAGGGTTHGKQACHDGQQCQRQGDRAGNQGRPEKAALVFPVLALEQPLEFVERGDGMGGVHA